MRVFHFISLTYELAITVARLAGNREDGDAAAEQTATILMISSAFGLSIFVLV